MPDQGPGSPSGGGGDPPIIITGGSVTVDLGRSHGKFQHDGQGKHHNAGQTVTRVVVKGGSINIDEAVPDGKIVIEVHYG